MPIPILYTEHLLLKSLASEDASQIQLLYPRWEIVRYMVSSVPWPYPDNGAESSGMRLIRTEKKEYVSGLLDSELWEITREEWNARQVG